MAFKEKQRGLEYYANYRALNKDKIRERDKAYRDQNADRLRESRRKYREANKEIIKAKAKARRDSETGKAYHATYTQKYLADPVRRMKHLWRGLRKRAELKGFGFDEGLLEALQSNIITECKCCGKLLDYESIGSGQNNRNNSPSIDRWDNTKGYTIENVRIICMRCNDLKKDGTLEEFKHIVKYMGG